MWGTYDQMSQKFLKIGQSDLILFVNVGKL